MADLDDELNEDLRKMARIVSHKQMARSKRVHNEDKEGDDGDGSMFEDLDEPYLPLPRGPARPRVLPNQVP